jgi:hypothetical protein
MIHAFHLDDSPQTYGLPSPKRILSKEIHMKYALLWCEEKSQNVNQQSFFLLLSLFSAILNWRWAGNLISACLLTYLLACQLQGFENREEKIDDSACIRVVTAPKELACKSTGHLGVLLLQSGGTHQRC